MAEPRHETRPRARAGAARVVTLIRGRPVPGLCDLAARALRCRRCSVMLADEHGRLVVEDSVGVPAGLIGTARVPVGEGVAGRVAATKAPIVVNEPAGRAGLPRSVGRYATDAFLSFPMALPDGTTGVVNLTERERATPFDADDVALLGDLTALYAATYDAPARREVLRVRAELRRVRARSIRAHEEERQRLARELHDDAGHALTAAIMRLDLVSQRLIGEGPLTDALTDIRGALTECADHLHDLAFDLRPRLLNDLGLAPALRSLARRVREASGLAVELAVHGEPRRLADELELVAFRVAQEATTNALKHARASRVGIDLRFVESGIDLVIEDDGLGFRPNGAQRATGRGGQGIHGMRERVELVGGTLDVGSRPGDGTAVHAWVPERTGA